VALFGSIAAHLDTPSSDVDLLLKIEGKVPKGVRRGMEGGWGGGREGGREGRGEGLTRTADI
jgi:hypothetical protein